MAFLIIGLALLALKLLEIDPVTAWSWWVVFVPFAAAVAWWSFADASGLTAKRESDKVYARGEKRREQHREALGIKRPATPGRRRS